MIMVRAVAVWLRAEILALTASTAIGEGMRQQGVEVMSSDLRFDCDWGDSKQHCLPAHGGKLQ
jgi:hypothetical protein